MEELNVTIEQKENELIITPIGRLDTITADNFKNKVLAAYNDNVETITIDMKGVNYVSSAGLRAFLLIYKTNHNKPIHCLNMLEQVHEVFEMTAFLKLIGE